MAKSREAEIVDKEFAASQKNKRMIEVYYGNASSDTGSDRFLNQCDSGANYYSVFEKTNLIYLKRKLINLKCNLLRQSGYTTIL